MRNIDLVIVGGKNMVFQITRIISAFAVLVALAGCLDEEGSLFGDDSYSSGGSSSSFSPRSKVSTGCPSACLSTSSQSSCYNVCNQQTGSYCLAAASSYENYVRNGQAGASSATTTQLYAQYTQYAELARDTVQAFGCR